MRAEAETRVREKANYVQRAAAEARQGRGINPMLKGGWQWRLTPISGPVPRSRDKRERGRRLRQGPRLMLRYGKMLRIQGRQRMQRQKRRMVL